MLVQVHIAVEKKADLVVFPECTVFGYHPFDLLERTELVEEQLACIKKFIRLLPTNIHVIFGAITFNKSKRGRPYFNSAMLVKKNKIIQIFNKHLLPTGDVFDEARFIEPGDLKKNFFSIKKKKFFLSICEDIWAWPDAKGSSPYSQNPLLKIPKKKIDLVINISASPFYFDKFKLRKNVVAATAKYFRSPMVYVNLVGAQDEIIFDGTSFLTDAEGRIKFQCQSFVEEINVFSLEDLTSWSAHVPPAKGAEQIRRALVLGIRDYCQKSGISRIHFGLSGGIDSAVVACLAVDALGPLAVSAIAMPGPFSAQMSEQLARKLSARLGIQYSEIPISHSYQVVCEQLQKTFLPKSLGVTHENLQARLRGMFLMAYANEFQSLLLSTSNKSEYATGYSTLYGDMCGGLAPLGDLLKHQVYDLAKHYNLETEIIPKEIILRPPTAELRPNQKDQDSLPSYDLLDESVDHLVTNSKRPRNKLDQWVLQKIYHTEFKRWQAPPILKVSAHAFGRGRRWPLAFKIAPSSE
jgi:NAD+ synthase (glutamine-hydrolysing)